MVIGCMRTYAYNLAGCQSNNVLNEWYISGQLKTCKAMLYFKDFPKCHILE